jgi:hydroxymethylglutaryl-CoA reductase
MFVQKKEILDYSRTEKAGAVAKHSTKDAGIEQGNYYASVLPKFYEMPIRARRSMIEAIICGDSSRPVDASSSLIEKSSLSDVLSDTFIENAVGSFALPLGVATNFLINGEDFLIPMAVEESSVLAAASHGAKIIRSGGGFKSTSSEPIMTGQIQFFPAVGINVPQAFEAHKASWLEFSNNILPRLSARGGGVKSLRLVQYQGETMCVIEFDVDTREAMGANIVNTIAERLSLEIHKVMGGRLGIRILTNLTLGRMAEASCSIPSSCFERPGTALTGEEIVSRILDAYRFAEVDIGRATTHNKGVMNGIDPVVIATGNDWRAVEAGAHAYACSTGTYKPMTRWFRTAEGDLGGCLRLPMALGTVGGVTALHPGAQLALKILKNPSAQKLAEIVLCVGLAQNLSALRALATEGIQAGHMHLHKKNSDLRERSGAARY